MKTSNEPFWWALFGAGGTLSSICVPVLLVLTGLAIPLGIVDAPSYRDALALVLHPLTRLFVFALVSLSFFHGAHRFRFTLNDTVLAHSLHSLFAIVCYGSAIVGTVLTGVVLWRL